MLKGVFVVVAVAMTSFLGLFLTKYIPYLKLELSQKKFSHYFLNQSEIEHGHAVNSTRKLMYLNELTEFPLLGSFFYEEKIVELILQAKYNESRVESSRAVQNPIHSRSFAIWYYKAVSECYLQLLEECEFSLGKASLYSSKYTHPYVEQIYDLLKKYAQVEKVSDELARMNKGELQAEEIAELVGREASRHRQQLEEL